MTQTASAQVVLKTDTVSVSCANSSVFLVPLRVRNFTDIAGLQFTFQWNPAHLEYAYITDINPAFNSIAFDSTSLISQGKFTFAWSQLNSLTFPDGEILLQVGFKRLGGPATALNFVNDPTPIFVYDASFNDAPFALEPGLVKPQDTALPTVACPANVTVQGAGPTSVNNIAPVSASDDCGVPAIGWSSSGATMANFPNDPDASGALFNIGASTLVYQASDVVGNTATCSFQVTVEFSVGDDLTFLTEVPTASCGDTISINIATYNFDTIAAFQFSMAWAPASLQYLSVSNLNTTLGLTQPNFGTANTGSGELSLAWDGPFSGTSLPDGATVFSVNFVVLGTTNLNFTDIPTPRIAFSGVNFPPEEITMVTVNGIIAVSDTIDPAITCPADVTVQAPGTVAVQNIAPASVLDNCAAPNIGWESIGATVDADPSDADASGTLFNQGSSTVTYTATDASGNTASCSFNVTVEFGVGSTDLTLVANNANAACNTAFSVDITTYNFNDIAGLQFSMGWDPAIIQYTSVSNFNPSLNLVQSNFGEAFVNMGQLGFGWTGPFAGTTLPDGALLFSLNFNMIGNQATTLNFTNTPTDIDALQGPAFPPTDIPVETYPGQINLLDNVAPTITCPANVTADAPQGSITANVSNLDPTMADNCGGAPTLSYIRTGTTTGSGTGNANGDYKAGTTVVTYTATDANGNTATCSFTVFVNADVPLTLHIDTVLVDCQGAAQVKHCITVDNFTDIIGLQFGLTWDTAVLKLKLPVPAGGITPTVTNGYPGFNMNQGMFFSFSTAPDGLLLFFGSVLTWPDIPTGDTLFCLNFDVENANASTKLEFQGPFNAVNTAFSPIPVDTTHGLFASSGDLTPPTVSCPPSITLNPSAGLCEATYMVPLPTAMDACGSVDTIVRVPSGDVFMGGATTVTYTATDQAGNSATCTLEITVVDQNPPQFTNCPPNVLVYAASNACSAPATWTPPSFSDCSAFTVENNFFPGDNFPATCAPTTVFYRATDAFDNVSTCQFTVMALDTTLPVIVCPADITVVLVNNCDTIVNYTAPTATDFCTQNVGLNGSPVSGSVFLPGVTTVEWLALDDCSNLAECTFLVTVIDGAAPTISNCPTDTVVIAAANSCSANVSWVAPTASDDCDAVVALVASDTPGSLFGVGGSITVTYTATDSSGNLSICSFSVTVEDQTAPTLTGCPSNIFVTLPGMDCDTMLTWTPPTAQDNCGNFTLTSNIDPGYNFTTGDTLVTYLVIDAFDNADSCSFMVTVWDQVPPVLSNCPPDITVDGNGACKVVADWVEPTATDNCSIPTVFSPFQPLVDSFMIGTTIVQIIAEDASNNYDTCTFEVIVIGVPPGFDLTTLPANVTVNACDTLMSWSLPTAVGFCDSSWVTSTPPSPMNYGPGVHTVLFTATDGMTSVTSTFVITVKDNIGPAIVCPTNPYVVNTGGIVLSGTGFITSTDTVAGCNSVQISYGFPSATDNCGPPQVTQNSGVLSGGVFALGPHTLTFTAADAGGNTVQCTVMITVVPLTSVDPVADVNPACLGETVVLSALSIPGATYQWTKLPGTVLATITNQHTIPAFSAQSAGIYTVSANVNGCLTPLDSVLVALITPPEPLNDMFTISMGALDTFNVFLNDGLIDSSDYTICNFEPDPLPAGVVYLGNGLFAYTEQTGRSVSFTYQLCYCNVEGETATVTILVDDADCSFLPNIITPNNDGQNDYLIIPCLDGRVFSENSIVIYNQWGDKVFEDKGYTNDPNDPSHPAWRGTLNGDIGKDLPDGVYFYIFKPSPSHQPIKGFIEIYR